MNRRKFKYEDYNKAVANADATKYFIVYEGRNKEPNYFEAFNEKFINPKKAFVCHVLEEDTGVIGNTPLKLKERIEQFIKNPPKKIAVSPGIDDKFRFVLDLDKHPMDQIIELEKYSNSLIDSGIFISNYCFEIWLWAHIDDLNKITSNTPKELKTELSKVQNLNYPHDFIDFKLINNAIGRCKMSNGDNLELVPKEKNSKVYLLIEELLDFSIFNTSKDTGGK